MHRPKTSARRTIHGLAASLCAGCALIAAPPAALAAVDQTTSYQVDPAHSGVLSGFDMALPPERQWSVKLGGTVVTPLVVNGVVYAASKSGSGTSPTLYALNQANGATIWTRTIGNPTGLAYDRGRILVEDSTGVLIAVDALSGALAWTAALPGQSSFSSPPTAIDGIVYSDGAGSGGTLYATDERNGALLWKRNVTNGGGSSPTVDGGRVYATYPGNFYAFDASSGSTAWSFSNGSSGGGGTAAVAAAGRVYIRDLQAARIVNASTGSLVGPLTSIAPPAVSGGAAFELVSGPSLVRIAGDGLGTQQWTFTGDGALDTAPVVIGDLVFVGSSAGRIYAVDPATGAERWSAGTTTGVNAGTGTSSAPTSSLAGGNGSLLVPAGPNLIAFAAPVAAGAPAASRVPAITGSAIVGSTLTLDIGVWSGRPSSYAVAWQRCDAGGSACTAIAGATGMTYGPTTADVDLTLRVAVTASNASGDSAETPSAVSEIVEEALPTNTAPPRISGSPNVGSVLSASTGDWTGTPTSFDYAWLRCAGSTCWPLPGATGATYTVTGYEVGASIAVDVTAHTAHHTSAPVRSAQTTAVPDLPPRLSSKPSITGSAVAGQMLIAVTTYWLGSPTSFAYRWERCDAAGEHCEAIAGTAATAPIWYLGSDDVGATVRVTAFATNAGGTGSSTSDATAVVLPLPPVELEAPAISGTARAGETLHADLGSWVWSPDHFSVQWLRCEGVPQVCEAIAGATRSSYVARDDDAGAILRVRVTASNAGGSSAAADSAGFGPVAAAPVADPPPTDPPDDDPPSEPPTPPVNSPGSGSAILGPPLVSGAPGTRTATPAAATAKPTIPVFAGRLSAPKRVSAATLRRDGLRVRASCPSACVARVFVYVRTSHGWVPAGTTKRRVTSPASATFRAKLSAGGRRALRTMRGHRLTVVGVVGDAAGHTASALWKPTVR